ncbi:MAG: Dabb family protein [Proteobacteria bacterium]|nr:Dabb family protein [Pseudomonadota bacterium]MDA1059119.1 Dabb family protein [Pseudomonadota bacterium]
MTYYHVILERYTAPFTPDEQREIEEIYGRIRSEVAGCVGYHRGPNVSPFAQGHTHVHISIWETKAAHDAYQVHPLHDRLVDIIVPKLEAVVADLDTGSTPRA